MKIYLVPNFNKEKTPAVFNDVIAFLKKHGAEITVSDEALIDNEFVFLSEREALCECDMVIVIGGDGSIIHTAKKAAVHNKAVLGINCGRVGFLSGLESKNTESISRIFNGIYKTERRDILTASFECDGKSYNLPFLNDAVISRGTVSRMIDLEVGFGDNSIDYRADGVIISTSTGATAYSMAAGGPIVDPELNAMIVTPISAHSFKNRSIVLKNSEKLTVTNTSGDDNDVFITIDGEESFKLESNYNVTISRSELVARLIKIDNTSFFNTLSDKLS